MASIHAQADRAKEAARRAEEAAKAAARFAGDEDVEREEDEGQKPTYTPDDIVLPSLGDSARFRRNDEEAETSAKGFASASTFDEFVESSVQTEDRVDKQKEEDDVELNLDLPDPPKHDPSGEQDCEW